MRETSFTVGTKGEKRDVLLVVDMLNDFAEEGGALYFPAAKEIRPRVAVEVSAARGRGDVVIYLCDRHKEDDKEFEIWPKHALEGTNGAEIVEEIKPTEGDHLLFKTRYSGFYKTYLEHVLNNANPDKVRVIGVCTSICVMDTVGGLRNRDYKVEVVKDAVADFDEEMHEMSLKRMENIYKARIV